MQRAQRQLAQANTDMYWTRHRRRQRQPNVQVALYSLSSAGNTVAEATLPGNTVAEATLMLQARLPLSSCFAIGAQCPSRLAAGEAAAALKSESKTPRVQAVLLPGLPWS